MRFHAFSHDLDFFCTVSYFQFNVKCFGNLGKINLLFSTEFIDKEKKRKNFNHLE